MGQGACRRSQAEAIVRRVVAEHLAAGEQQAEVFTSAEAEAAKDEIVSTGRKLWQRQYVDGNGGNISCRIARDAVLCTPTLLSKGDLTAADLCLVDLDGRQLAGPRARTSEVLMHLEIYKAVPEAGAVLHCHPPHATAYAITGQVPPSGVIPEYEIFIGELALARYETPGTRAFAEAVLPFVREHNAVLLANHGIVCWADTVTHAEWCAEIVDTYCWTLMLAAQLGAPPTRIPPEKLADLRALKRRLRLADPRFEQGPEPRREETGPEAAGVPPEEVETIVQAITDAVMARLG